MAWLRACIASTNNVFTLSHGQQFENHLSNCNSNRPKDFVHEVVCTNGTAMPEMRRGKATTVLPWTEMIVVAGTTFKFTWQLSMESYRLPCQSPDWIQRKQTETDSQSQRNLLRKNKSGVCRTYISISTACVNPTHRLTNGVKISVIVTYIELALIILITSHVSAKKSRLCIMTTGLRIQDTLRTLVGPPGSLR